ncbi:MAG: DUF1583 domain-containing protein, partial [Gemmataceae bacterium]|nr:DUF1583 domain-containing protein [Gemmataceae bacterium]
VALADAFHDKTNQAMIENKQFDDKWWWERLERFLYARAYADPAAPFGADGLRHWASAPGGDPHGRGRGFGAPHWEVKDGVLTHRPGYDEDFLAFRSPLRGDFEITCELRVQGWEEAAVHYGGLRISPNHEFKKLIVIAPRGDRRESTLEKPVPDAKPRWYRYKLAVKDGVLTASVDDQVIGTEKVGPNADPWLMLHAHYMNTAPVRNLVINGNPVVPKAVDLLADDGLGCWRGDSNSGAWAKRGEEMYHPGTPVPDDPEAKPQPRGYPEAAAFYHRPLLEDGAVEYEWYHDPGKADAHPALDRLVFLLDPDGVKLHRLTDGAQDRAGASPTNEAVEQEHRRGPSKLPLKPKAWNKCRLEVKGDVVVVSVNGVAVYERPIPPANLRTFGVFHYTDRGEARVRSMTLTGDWPTALPPNGELFAPKK